MAGLFSRLVKSSKEAVQMPAPKAEPVVAPVVAPRWEPNVAPVPTSTTEHSQRVVEKKRFEAIFYGTNGVSKTRIKEAPTDRQGVCYFDTPEEAYAVAKVATVDEVLNEFFPVATKLTYMGLTDSNTGSSLKYWFPHALETFIWRNAPHSIGQGYSSENEPPEGKFLVKGPKVNQNFSNLLSALGVFYKSPGKNELTYTTPGGNTIHVMWWIVEEPSNFKVSMLSSSASANTDRNGRVAYPNPNRANLYGGTNLMRLHLPADTLEEAREIARTTLTVPAIAGGPSDTPLDCLHIELPFDPSKGSRHETWWTKSGVLKVLTSDLRNNPLKSELDSLSNRSASGAGAEVQLTGDGTAMTFNRFSQAHTYARAVNSGSALLRDCAALKKKTTHAPGGIPVHEAQKNPIYWVPAPTLTKVNSMWLIRPDGSRLLIIDFTKDNI